MAENKALLYGGLALAAVAGFQLLQKPAPAAPPPGPPPPGPPPPQTGYVVTASDGLIVRTGPGRGYPALRTLPYQTPVQIACQAMGERIGNSSVWDRLSGPMAGWVSDWYVSTPGVGSFSSGLAQCAAVAAPPPVPSPPSPTGLPPTGGGRIPVDDAMRLPPGCIIAVRCGDRAGKTWFIESATAAQSVGRNRQTVPWSGKSYYRFKRLIKDDQAWRQLGDPWRAIYLVTSACRDDLAWGPDLDSSGAYGWQHGGPRNGILRAAAGYCA